MPRLSPRSHRPGNSGPAGQHRDVGQYFPAKEGVVTGDGLDGAGHRVLAGEQPPGLCPIAVVRAAVASALAALPAAELAPPRSIPKPHKSATRSIWCSIKSVRAGNAVLAPKGTPVLATIIVADHAAHGLPGDLAFEVIFTVHGTEVPLQGGETLEGLSRFDREDNDQIDIPGRGPAAKAIRHGEALIQPGMTFTAAVAKDTRLQP